MVAIAVACGGRKPPPPRSPAAVYHQVRAGETLVRIGRAYGVDYRVIARANALADPTRITVGQRLLIPGAAYPVEVPPLDGLALAPLDRAAVRARPPDTLTLRWPVTGGTVTSLFGPRNGAPHDGIDIAAPSGAAVRAAADGDVVYSGALPGYGNMLIVRHVRGYVTVYAHNEQHHAAEGTHVRAGQLIATIGRTGRATAPNLHFEVRKDNIAYDPLQFLPPLTAVQATRALDGRRVDASKGR
jgi:murein DD-endopeptidase MepM/ murein hydrolase activator NlpD